MRKTKQRTERAVLDFFIVCNKILPFILKLVIDEERKFSLTNYNGKVTESDHFTMIFEVNLSMERKATQRVEMYNFKNQQNQEIFHQKSSNRMELIQCFTSDESVVQQGGKWFKLLNNVFQESFTKIRITNKVNETDISRLLKQRSEVKLISK